MSEIRKLLYTLIIYPDDECGPLAISCDTPEQREEQTIEAIFGEKISDSISFDEWEKMKETLLTEGTLKFEGDQPIQWLTEWAQPINWMPSPALGDAVVKRMASKIYEHVSDRVRRRDAVWDVDIERIIREELDRS